LPKIKIIAHLNLFSFDLFSSFYFSWGFLCLLFPYLSSSKKASALLITFFVVFIVCSLLGTLLLPLTLRSSASQFDIEKFHALNIAEAGLANVMDNIQNGGTGALGTKSAPLPYHHGSYYTLITLKTPSLLLNEIQVIGNYRRATCTVKIVTDYPIPAEGTPPILDENPLIPLSEPIFSKGNITITGSTDLTASVRSNKTITAQGSGLKFNGDLKAAEKVKLIGKPKILGEILEGSGTSRLTSFSSSKLQTATGVSP
jgi:hypothetical protein